MFNQKTAPSIPVAADERSIPGQTYVANRVETTQPETELGYAARVAEESQHRLGRSVEELVERLQIVLSAETPSPQGPEVPKANRSVSSPIANALLSHSAQTDNINGMVRNLLRRLAI